MAEKVKPIKTERIDNPDGTYTVKSIFDKNEDYLSKIENFTKDNDLIQATWYKDNDFSDVICIQINNLDENIITKFIDLSYDIMRSLIMMAGVFIIEFVVSNLQ